MMLLKFLCLAVGIFSTATAAFKASAFIAGRTKSTDLTVSIATASLAWAGYIML